MSNKPLISVVVPVYNVAPYLAQCLDSLIHQTYSNLQIILVNDGSTDDSLSICERYATNDKRIIVINRPNGGLSAARNTGLAYATGDYISFVDSDDWLELDTYARCLTLFCLYPTIGMVKFGLYYDAPEEQSVLLRQERHFPAGEYFRIYAATLEMAVVWNALSRRELIGTLRFKEGALHEDEYYTLELLCRQPSVEVYQLESPLYHYRIGREGAITSKVTEKHMRDLVRGFDEVYQVASELNNDTSGLCLLRMLVIYRSKYSMVSYHYPELAPIFEGVLSKYHLDILPKPQSLGVEWYTRVDYYNYKAFARLPQLDYYVQRGIDIFYRLLLEPIFGKRKRF